jgi:hypothetical protein
MTSHLQNLLPEYYTVGPTDVIIGRGKRCTQNPGNRRFRAIVEATLGAYSNAPTKSMKSEIIMQVLSEVRSSNGVGFVKLVNYPVGRFIQVEEASCRIAIAQAFRDALSGSYKSSKKYKQIRRIERMQGEEITAINAWCFESVSRSMFLEEAPMPNLFRSKQYPEQAAPGASSINMSQLRDMLSEANMLVFQLDNDEQELTSFQEGDERATTNSSDLFCLLYTAFCNDNATCDPFEPTPIAEGNALPSNNACTSRAA